MTRIDVVTELVKLDRFVELCLFGLENATEATSFIDLRRETAEILKQPDPYPTPERYEHARQQALALESFAKEERTAAFPYVFSLAVIKLWSILETWSDDLLVAELRSPEKCRDQRLLMSLEGPLLDFAKAGQDEQAELLATELKLAVKAPLKLGVSRFEALFEPLGLDGPVPDVVRKTIFELSQARNVIVHRGAIADKRFVEACPWLALGIGQPLLLGPTHFHCYALGARWYVVELDRRFTDRDGAAPRQKVINTLAALLTRLSDVWTARAPGSPPAQTGGNGPPKAGA
jgi:hypothetical protein